jgi:hypothetical protein
MIKKPPFRKLRGYAFDPSLSLKMDTATINDILYKIPWEELSEGPKGEYIEVIDYDPTVKKFYRPVNLDNPFLLAQDGHDPSESNPEFHQQMVYAVSMLTIKHFEKALGRKVLWAPRRVADFKKYEEPVMQLRIYPHALRDANAYYSPMKKALLFGYFSSTPADETLHMPDSLVFTCLSHDIIAHETTHAILDGMHNYYNEPTNPDMLAFHEAFADIVALFQHFTFPEVLRHQIAKTKGDLGSQNLLGQLAQEFGSAIGNYGSLRDALGEIDETTNQWKPKNPNPDDYRNVKEPHERGSILVAAVFEAFVSIYKSRVTDLIRIATKGSGILPQGELDPDLVNRLAGEAAKSASHVLEMCIRALDYCPPIDLTFGDYLRAIITADVDIVVDDNRDYRLAFIDAFRKRGIYAEDIKTLSVDSLQYPLLNLGFMIDKDGKLDQKSYLQNKEMTNDTKKLLGIINNFLREYASAVQYEQNRSIIYEITKKYIAGYYDDPDNIILGLHRRLGLKFRGSLDFSRITGLAFINNYFQIGVPESSAKNYDGPSFQIQNLRLISRVGPSGNQVNEVIFSLIQRSGVVFKEGEFEKHYQPNLSNGKPVGNDQKNIEQPLPKDGFEFRGACTLIFDLDSLQLKYAISKPLIDVQHFDEGGVIRINMKRLKNQYAFQYEESDTDVNEFAQYFGNGVHTHTEPFAFLHQH